MYVIDDNNAFLMAMGAGSRIEIHAADRAKDSWTQISETATAGATTLTLAENTGWQPGDRIVIAASGFDMNMAEERTITRVSADGRTVTLDSALEHEHLGQIRTYHNGLNGDDFQSWQVDMRAEVALLSRNVTIQGDADSAADGYGGHIMVMNMPAEGDTKAQAFIHVDGAELTRMGQEGIVGRYPLHWHMLGDASGQYLTNASIHHTYNKGLTVHGTQNTWVENVAIHDTIGHTYYFEDGSEFGNVVMNTLGMTTRASASLAAAPIGSDFTQVSTYWLTNPANHLINNHAAGSADTGFWILSQDIPQGTSAASDSYADYSPRAQTPGQWTGNLSHSNRDDGIWIGSQFDETDGSKNFEPLLEQPFSLTDYTTYSNGGWGIWQRNGHGDYAQIKIAESNAGVQMWGSSRVEDSLFVGRATNTGDPLDQYVGWQLYDNPTAFSGVHFEGYTGDFDSAISNGWGFGRSLLHSATGLSFGSDGTAQNYFRNTLTNRPEKVSDQGGPIAGGLIDLDGTLTGTPGAIVTPGLVDFQPDQFVDVLTYADDSIAASGFNWTAGAQWLPDHLAWVHAPGTIIGKMTVVQQTRDADGKLQDVQEPYDADRVVYTIERSDNGAKIEINKDAMVSYAWHMQYNLDTSAGVEYIFDYSAETPDAISFELTELPEGATALYRFRGLPDGVVFQKADAAPNMVAFDAATATTWIRDPGGDYLVKGVAQIIDYRAPMRSADDIATSRVFTDDFTLIVQPQPGEAPTGNDPWQRDLQVFEPAAPDPLPTRPESTSETVDILATDARWSDAGSWDRDLPGVDDIVIIGAGQRIVLDTYVKVGAILVNGGELIVEDRRDLKLAADWILVSNGGLLQVGTEENPFVHDFELTLEGDDRENDVDLLDLVNSTAPNIIRAMNPEHGAAPQTTQRVVADVTDSGDWDYRKFIYDDSGSRITFEIVYDDGRVSTTHFENGIRSLHRSVDAEDARDWDQLITRYDANGIRTQFVQRYDDGRVAITDFVNGQRSAFSLTDHADARTWTDILTTYATNSRPDERVITYDDGRVSTTSYSNGIRTEMVTIDAGNAYDWERSVMTYSGTGTPLQNTLIHDDGRIAVTDYENGARAVRVMTDPANTADWSTITTSFAADGKIAQMLTDYDDGRIATTSYTDGKRTQFLVEDRANAHDFLTSLTTYAENGARLQTVRSFDDGSESQITQHTSLVQAINLGGGSFTASNGLVYDADPFGIGNSFGVDADIAGTGDAGLYHSSRWNPGTLSYDIPVASGIYLLELNFAELFEGTANPGQRVFDIYVEDALVFDDLDIVSEAGFRAALDLIGQVEVSDGALSLSLVGQQNNPTVSALSLWASDGTAQQGFRIGTISDEFSFL